MRSGKAVDQNIYDNFIEILRRELVPALGCTEPIAVAYAAAKAASLLGCRPDRVEMYCSGNVVKNAQGVTVPNSGGLKGIEAAAIMGALGGNASRELEVLEDIDPAVVSETALLIGTGYCRSALAEDVANLYLRAKVFAGNHVAEVEIEHKHTNIIRMTMDGRDLFIGGSNYERVAAGDKNLLNISNILAFADMVKIDDIKKVLDNQIHMNSAISDEGLKGSYGVCVGKTLLRVYGDDIKIRAKARAAAGSDARMGGSSLPVVINSGSGNQGLTVSLPVIEYAKEMGLLADEKLYRALVVSNLVALHQKKCIGNLSAYCGAVCAACGSGAAITYLHGGGYDEISRTIINTIANVGGIVCDGAKPSCAAKIASSVDAAIMAHHMSMANHVFGDGEGLVQQDVERTILNVGHVGRVGMRSTDLEILGIMLSKDLAEPRSDKQSKLESETIC